MVSERSSSLPGGKMTVTGLGIIYLKQYFWQPERLASVSEWCLQMFHHLLAVTTVLSSHWSACSTCLPELSRREDEFLVQMQSLPRRNAHRKVSSFPQWMCPSVPESCLMGQRRGDSPEQIHPSMLSVLHPGVWWWDSKLLPGCRCWSQQ